ncbi:MAG: hypothetical protein ACYCOX_00300 [Acidobacteriaceae bacterium]
MHALIAIAFRACTASATMVQKKPDFPSHQNCTAGKAGADGNLADLSRLKAASNCQPSKVIADNNAEAISPDAQKANATGKSSVQAESKLNVAGQPPGRKAKATVRHSQRSSKTDRVEDAQRDAGH